ncbi:MAG: succinate dehydrogenase iron-sulfur subunit [Phycisphaerae bacterium]|nr:succinate dehydrogenase iron-sulfur subunit [Phycisphaerae bacterium]MCZ2399466.1 succinate dehydrogenase iron-sulfur subunit [Phycisphaerae bacterium]NUQ48733.1 succinate dehydrogenase iron-sulfur subunit [Phycisphaerae bacterium]
MNDQAQRTISVRVRRQDRRGSAGYWQTFRIAHQPNMNVISLLQEIAARPVTVEGRHTAPVVYDSNCLENVCGSCSMVINGRARQACNTLVDALLAERPQVEIAPLSKFPVVRDLFVDRSRMFDALKKVRAWIPVDTYGPIGEGPVVAPEDAATRYDLSRCMTCGCCLEVCPQVNHRSEFIGPQAIGQAALFNLHPTGAMNSGPRLEALMEPGGISDCGNAQNCVKACPKQVPLTWAIGKVGRDTTLHAIRRWLMK